MNNIEHLPHRLDEEKAECRAIVETPKGHRNKFKYDPETLLFTVSRVLPEGFIFPFDFGFVPSTLGEDGDPLDVLVLMDEPAHVGCLLNVRLVGVIEVEQTENGEQSRNDRLIGVALQSLSYRDVKSVSDMKPSFVEEVTDFLALYNKNSDSEDKVKGVRGPNRALALVKESAERFEKQKKS